jgi:hypothetical protein
VVSGPAIFHSSGASKSARGSAAAKRGIVTWRMRSFAECSASFQASSVLRTVHSMFDWPEHSHTSPTSTSRTLCSRSRVRTDNVKGPPAGIGGSATRQRPSLPAFTCAVAFDSVTVTPSPGFAWP